jgi:hypothetical protein
MKPDWEVLAELGVFLDLDPEGEDIAAAAFDRLGFPHSAAHYGPDLVRQLVLDLERRREADVAVREYQEDGLGRGRRGRRRRGHPTPGSGAGDRGRHQCQIRRTLALTNTPWRWPQVGTSQ